MLEAQTKITHRKHLTLLVTLFVTTYLVTGMVQYRLVSVEVLICIAYTAIVASSEGLDTYDYGVSYNPFKFKVHD
jgi:hypothetical protein